MAIVIMEGFDLAASSSDMTGKGWDFSEGTHSTTSGRFGAGGYDLGSSTSTVLSKTLDTPANKPYISVAFWYKTNTLSTDGTIVALRDTASSGSAAGFSTSHIFLRHGGSGSIRVYTSGTLRVTTSAVLLAATWQHLEVRIFIDGTSGTLSVLIDGIEVVSFSGDTKDSGNLTSVSFSGATGSPTLYDDIVVAQDASTLPAVIGEHKIHTLLPDANTAQADWTGAFTDIDDPIGATDGDTTFINTATLNAKSEFSLADLTESPATIHAVQTVVEARKTDAGTKGVTQYIQSGTTRENAVEFTAAESYSYHVGLHELDPNTAAAWTVAGVNAVLVGVEITT